MNRVSQVFLMHQHTNLTERLSSSVLTNMNFSKPGTKMNFQNSNKNLLGVSDRMMQLSSDWPLWVYEINAGSKAK